MAGRNRLETSDDPKGEPQLPPVSPAEALIRIEQSLATPAQKKFMQATVEQGKSFWHDFGDGPVCILDISHFFNHRVDIGLLTAMANEMAQPLRDTGATVGLTAASSGNIITYEVCRQLGLSGMIYAYKNPNVVLRENGYFRADALSYTSGHAVELSVGTTMLSPSDRAIIIDDFVDTGRMTHDLYSIVQQSGAELVGVAYGVNKVYAGGMDRVLALTSPLGLPRSHVMSFIDILAMDTGIVQFEGFDAGFRLQRQEES